MSPLLRSSSDSARASAFGQQKCTGSVLLGDYTRPVANDAFVGQRIREERHKSGMSLARLASATGLSKTYLIRLETDETSNPSLGVLSQITDALDITVADLLDRPKVRLDESEIAIPTSLRVFADEAGLGASDVQTLASIRWRQGDTPKTPERWRYLWEQLSMSREIDKRADSNG